MTIQTHTYVSPALPATVLRYDGKTLHILTNNPDSAVDPNGNVVLNVTKINTAKSDDTDAPASIAAQGQDAQNSTQNHDSPHATIDLTA